MRLSMWLMAFSVLFVAGALPDLLPPQSFAELLLVVFGALAFAVGFVLAVWGDVCELRRGA